MAPRVRFLRAIGWTLVWLGGLTLGFVVHQLWVTTLLAQLQQGDLDADRQLRFVEANIVAIEYVPEASPPDSSAPTGGSSDGVASQLPSDEPGGEVDAPVLLVESPPEPHQAFALIRVPSIDGLAEGWNVVEGVRRDDLRTGAGHMPWTALPGQPGNAVISGHRTTYGAPFKELDTLRLGDRIEVDTALGTHVYEVRDSLVVHPSDVWVTGTRQGAWLTLTTCNPRFSARQRLVIVAELIEGPNADAIRGSA